jgi:hypothetical protein
MKPAAVEAVVVVVAAVGRRRPRLRMRSLPREVNHQTNEKCCASFLRD